MIRFYPLRGMAYITMAMLCLTYTAPVNADLLDLSDLPLFLSSTKVPANILFVIDDSGSMDWEVMTKDADNDGVFSNTQPDGSSAVNDGEAKHRSDCSFDSGTRAIHGYAYTTKFPNNTAKEICDVADDRSWRFRNSDFNPLYFNPNRIYKPWIGYDNSGTLMGNMPISAARDNPYDANSPTIDLTRQNSELSTSDYDKDGQPDGYRYYTWKDLDGDGYFDDDEKTEHLIKNADAETQQNFANWFSYHRSREYVSKAAFGEVLAGLSSNFRAGLITMHNNAGSNLPIGQINESIKTGQQRKLLDALYKIHSKSGTPLRKTLDQAGKYFSCDYSTDLGFSDCPVLSSTEGGSCQQNFVAMMTDGFYNDKTFSGVGNTDGPDNGNTNWDGGAYADKWSDTLADIAMKYYESDLHKDLDDNVPIIPGLDEAKHQHVVTYAIAFGVNGTLTENPVNETDESSWPDPTKDGAKAEKIDDLRHAAYNGRGGFLSANQPEKLVETLHTILDSIQDRKTSAASVALNSGSYNQGSQVYQAQFVTGAWGGHLRAFPIDEKGNVQAEIWDSGKLLDNQNWDTERHILTYHDETKQGIGFRWSELSDEMRGLLNLNANGIIDDQGRDRLEFLRGNRDRESVDFRRRRQVLGDLINSAPVFVGAPVFPNELDPGTYPNFRNTHKDRQHMLYVGGNDGMLHGFSSTDGKERLAYIPRAIFDGLSQLTDPKYRHRYYVDGSPTVADADLCMGGGCWHSVLVSGLRKGGQAVFALDVTHPDKFSENNTDIVLWEFSDKDDPDLGYTYSTPSIVKMTGDRWAVILGNGYNNTEADGYVSSDGKAALFILFLNEQFDGVWTHGDDYIKIPVPDSNGLSSPAAVDMDGDFDTEYIYAGDLQGNMWKFDVTSLDPNDPNSWSVTRLFTAIGDDGNLQPITTQPEVGRHPEGQEVMVYFGTGKYLESSDHSTTVGQQTFYGIRDRHDNNTLAPAQLFNHIVKDEGDNRITTTENSYDTCIEQSNGWRMNLPTSGERQVTDSLLRNKRIIFTTMIPSTVPCSFGGNSWIMEFDAICGNRLDESPFDLNNDHEFTDADKIGNPPISVSGIKSTEGIAPSPSILFAKKEEFKYVSGSTGNIFKTVENPGENARGRIAWQQFK